MYEIRDAVVIVTGGAGGLGASIVKDLIKNGARGVSILDLDEGKGNELIENIQKEYGNKKALFIKTDVSKGEDLKAAYEKTIATWDKLDIVINNAGVANESKWELLIAVNVNHVVQSALLAMQYMGKHNGGQGGTILNIASMAGLLPSPSPLYSGSKHFVVGFGRSLARPYLFDETRVRILTFCPSYVDTPIIQQVSAVLPGFERMRERKVELVTSGVKQKPEDVSTAICKVLKEGENGSIWIITSSTPLTSISTSIDSL